MATTIKSEVSVKNLETVSNGFKITSEVRLGSVNKIQSINVYNLIISICNVHKGELFYSI